MSYGEIDQLAINSIRLLAVSFPPLNPSSPTPPTGYQACVELGAATRRARNGVGNLLNCLDHL